MQIRLKMIKDFLVVDPQQGDIFSYDETEGAWKNTPLNIDLTATTDTIPLRGENGIVNVGDPSEDSHATTKQYVDTMVATVSEGNILEQFGDLSRNVLLTGLTLNTNPIIATDNFLTAFGKTQGQLNTLLGMVGEPNGVASLDANGKLPVEQMPINALIYMGQWDASTNTPTLSNSNPAIPGDFYRCDVAGSVDFGAGTISFNVGDIVIFRGSDNTWVKILSVDAVQSVNTKKGDVVLDASDILYMPGITIKNALDSFGARMVKHGSNATPGSSVFLDINGVRITVAYYSTANSRATMEATDGNKFIDFRRLSIYNAATEQQNWDSHTLTSSPITIDSLIYGVTNETPMWRLRVDNQVWDISFMISGSGARVSMWAECVAP